MIADFHIHLSPEVPRADGPPATRYARGVPVGTHHGLLGDADGLLRFIDELGIDVAVLSSGAGMRGGVEGAAAANAALADVVARHPDRLRFLVHVAPAEGWVEAAAAWLDRSPGVALPSRVGDLDLDAPELEPLFALLEERGKFLFVHPALVPTAEEAALYDAYDLYRTVGREFSLVTATLRLVFGGVLDRHPRLRVVISHLGGGIAPLLGRIRHYQDKDLWGIADDPVHGRTAERPLDEYLRRMWFDTGGFFGDRNAIRAALLELPRDRILLGSDYPQEIRDAGDAEALMATLREEGLAGNGAELL